MGQSVSTRRTFLFGSSKPAEYVARPPGFNFSVASVCADCAICAAHCPTSIIIIVDGLPQLELARGECTFCGACQAICPHEVLSVEPATTLPHYMTISDKCLALASIDCQCCRDVCPPGAIRFIPQLGRPFQPKVNADACTGCGACVSVCPSSATLITARLGENGHA